MQGGLNLPPLRKSVRFSSLKLEHLFTEQIGFVALNSWFVIGNLEKQLDNLPVYTPLEWYSVIGYQSPQKTEYFRTEYQIARIVFRIDRSEEHTSELQSRFGISYAVFCLKKKFF